MAIARRIEAAPGGVVFLSHPVTVFEDHFVGLLKHKVTRIKVLPDNDAVPSMREYDLGNDLTTDDLQAEDLEKILSAL